MHQVDIPSGRIAVSEAGSGLPLMFVHGFPLDHSQWIAQVESLSDLFRVISFDLPGFGESLPRKGPVSMANFADDCAELIAALGVDRPVVFVGLSMGGYIGWEFARRHSEHLAGLVLCNTRAAQDSKEVARGRRVMAERVRSEGVGPSIGTMLPKLFARENSRHAQIEFEAMRSVMRSTPTETFAQAQIAMAERDNAQLWLAQIVTPTLVIGGSDDQITPASEMKQWAARMPDARFVEIPDAGHLSPVENPQAFNEVVEKFVTRKIVESDQ